MRREAQVQKRGDVAGDEYCRRHICHIWELMSYSTRFEWSGWHHVSTCVKYLQYHMLLWKSHKIPHEKLRSCFIEVNLCFKTCRLLPFPNTEAGRKVWRHGLFFTLTIIRMELLKIIPNTHTNPSKLSALTIIVGIEGWSENYWMIKNILNNVLCQSSYTHVMEFTVSFFSSVPLYLRWINPKTFNQCSVQLLFFFWLLPLLLATVSAIFFSASHNRAYF